MNLVHNHRHEQPITGAHRTVVASDSAKRRTAHDAQVRIAASIMAEAKAVADLVQREGFTLGLSHRGPSGFIEADGAGTHRRAVGMLQLLHVGEPDTERGVGVEVNEDRVGECDAPESENQGDEGSHVAILARVSSA
jgi:hypothetical protein